MRAALLLLLLSFAGAALAQSQSPSPLPANPPAEAAAESAADNDSADAPEAEVLGANGQRLSSRRDYTDPAERDAPIVCKEGDLERHAGKTLGQVFGDAWPAHPAPAVSATRARTLTHGKLVWPRGMEGKTGLIVVAVLVGADGKPLRAEPLCATTTGFDMAARREAMGATYEAAIVDGQAVVSPTVRVLRFMPPRRQGGGRPRPATDD